MYALNFLKVELILNGYFRNIKRNGLCLLNIRQKFICKIRYCKYYYYNYKGFIVHIQSKLLFRTFVVGASSDLGQPFHRIHSRLRTLPPNIISNTILVKLSRLALTCTFRTSCYSICLSCTSFGGGHDPPPPTHTHTFGSGGTHTHFGMGKNHIFQYLFAFYGLIRTTCSHST